MTTATAARKYERVTLPWGTTTADLAKMMKAWQESESARDFMDKHQLTSAQFKRVKDMMHDLRKRYPKIKILKAHAHWADNVDFDELKKVAKDLGVI